MSGCQKKSNNLKLIVSNQSFAVPSVDISVDIDGKNIVSKDFPVKDQHYQEDFFVDLPIGYHSIEIKANKGIIVLKDKFEVCKDKNMIIVIDFFRTSSIDCAISYKNNKYITSPDSADSATASPADQ